MATYSSQCVFGLPFFFLNLATIPVSDQKVLLKPPSAKSCYQKYVLEFHLKLLLSILSLPNALIRFHYTFTPPLVIYFKR
jgi:hypothetical protein